MLIAAHNAALRDDMRFQRAVQCVFIGTGRQVNICIQRKHVKVIAMRTAGRTRTVIARLTSAILAADAGPAAFGDIRHRVNVPD